MKPKIGMLKWEAGLTPLGLIQLEKLKGNSTNPDSYPFDIWFESVPGACTETIITNPDPVIPKRMIEIGKKMIEEGVKAILTSCGFNAILQTELSEALEIPVFSSSLLQIPLISNIIGKNRKTAIITANSASLSEKHLQNCGARPDMDISIYGLEYAHEFNRIFQEPDQEVDLDVVADEVVGMAVKAREESDNLGAILLECTDLPPFAEKIREELDLPVFDIITLATHAAMSVGAYTPK
jgi:hypothetical protein